MRLFGTSRTQHFVSAHLRGRGDLAGRVVVDLPAGEGTSAALLHELGAQVEPYDLFPAFFKVPGLECRPADLNGRLPIADAHADLVLCQEGIEHLPNQLAALMELNRILKPGGTLLLTTPNVSHLRARLSHLLLESDLHNRLPPTEVDSIWFSGAAPEPLYFGHLFLIPVQKLRILARLAGFSLARVLPGKASALALALGVLWPLLALVNLYAYASSVRRFPGLERAWKRQVYREVLWLNLHPEILFGKHLFLEFRKDGTPQQAAAGFHRKFRPATG
jgi:SAM-dependent methyltransferase